VATPSIGSAAPRASQLDADHGGALLAPLNDDDDEYTWAARHTRAIAPAEDSWLIGLDDIDVEAVWVWVDGQPLTLEAPFKWDQPDNSGNCATIWWSPGGLDDVPCDSAHPFVCKSP
jgi:hypothetical protein